MEYKKSQKEQELFLVALSMKFPKGQYQKKNWDVFNYLNISNVTSF